MVVGGPLALVFFPVTLLLTQTVLPPSALLPFPLFLGYVSLGAGELMHEDRRTPAALPRLASLLLMLLTVVLGLATMVWVARLY